jgi:DNA-binding IclR family transcriptional regulator
VNAIDQPDDAATRRYSVPPVVRAIRLLQAISDGETATNLKQTALALGINRTTLMRLLHTLEAARFIEPIPNGNGYRIGLGLVGLVARAASYSQDLMVSATPIVTRLAETLGLSAHLAVLDGTDALFLLRQVPNVPLASNIQPGSRIPAYATTLGRIILAYWPAQRVTELFRETKFRPFSEHTPRSLKSFHAVLAADRAAGHAWSDGHYTPGVCSAGFAVFDRTSRPIAAINVTGPQFLFKESAQRRKEIIEAVRGAAHELSSRLGSVGACAGATNGVNTSRRSA